MSKRRVEAMIAMARLFDHSTPFLITAPPSRPEAGTWDYWRPAVDGVLEFGAVRGQRVGLPTHFHEEDQATFVLPDDVDS
jgi:hypothetical protein